ncbi:MAG: neutral zinc metallopeptidase [Clostridiaceae bacterium]
MKWRGRKSSSNVDDRRGSGGVGMGGIGALGGGFGIIALIVYVLMGGDPGVILNQTQPQNPGQGSSYSQTTQEKELSDFVSVVLADTEFVWSDVFTQMDRTYQEPTLVLFSGQVQSACGVAGSSTGPFYCPADSKVYIDLSFYKELETKFKAPGDFAMAYVIAHEVGHHVQNQLGVMNEVNGLRGRLSDKENNELSVRLELQADYLAGVWAKHAQSMDLLDQGDVEEALNAANAIGDDRIQKQTQGYVVPDSFTHGTSAQRIKWFTKGFQEGDLDQWDTFSLNEADL